MKKKLPLFIVVVILIVVFLISFIVILGLSSCGTESDVEIDYGNSSIYAQDDMDAAITVIKQEFSTWKGCELHAIRYTSDDCNCEENIEWVNNLGGENSNFAQCIIFEADFRSPKDGGGAWEADHEYTNWKWVLARTDRGEWNLMTWGYG